MKVLSGHLTARKKQIINEMLRQNIFDGGTKLIQFKITQTAEKTFSIKCYEKYAIASRSFDCRPESNVVKWHYEGKVLIQN